MIFFFIFFILPLIEISLFIVVGQSVGVLNTILLCVLAGFAGSFILKTQGIRTLLAIQETTKRGQIPLQEMFDGFCMAVAGGLLLLPGFFSDIVAAALLIPPVRTVLREQLMKRYGLREMTSSEEEIIEAEFRRVDIERIERHD